MNRSFSLYLDLVRFLAACMVLLYHSNIRSVITEKLPLSDHGHAAVIVFFVLSGYVVAFITDTRENTPSSYWASRLSRIYSLALPAVFLTLALDWVGQGVAPALYDNHTLHDHVILRIGSSLLFLNEIWSVSITTFSNVPYWSLCYEMWYYILFGIVTFVEGPKRWWIAGLICLALGPKIPLLLPLWLLGVVLYRWEALKAIPEWLGWLCFLGSCLLYVLFHSADVTGLLSDWLRQQIGAEWHKQLTFSKFFVGDYLLGPIVLMNFVGFRRIASRFEQPLSACAKPIKTLATYTFALYILHQPLLQLYAGLVHGDPARPYYYLTVIALIGLTVWLAGWASELWRPRLRAWLHARLSEGAAARMLGAFFRTGTLAD